MDQVRTNNTIIVLKEQDEWSRRKNATIIDVGTD